MWKHSIFVAFKKIQIKISFNTQPIVNFQTFDYIKCYQERALVEAFESLGKLYIGTDIPENNLTILKEVDIIYNLT
jgi:hypothetical protein